MSLKSKSLNYELTSGSASMTAEQLDGENIIVQLSMSNIQDSNTTLSLEQSVDGVTYQTVSDSEVTLSENQTVQMWNVRGMVFGAFLRIKVVTTSTEGILYIMQVLTSTR